MCRYKSLCCLFKSQKTASKQKVMLVKLYLVSKIITEKLKVHADWLQMNEKFFTRKLLMKTVKRRILKKMFKGQRMQQKVDRNTCSQF